MFNISRGGGGGVDPRTRLLPWVPDPPIMSRPPPPKLFLATALPIWKRICVSLRITLLYTSNTDWECHYILGKCHYLWIRKLGNIQKCLTAWKDGWIGLLQTAWKNCLQSTLIEDHVKEVVPVEVTKYQVCFFY